METNGKYMVKIKILNNNSNNEATVNQKAINPFFQQTSSEKNNKPRQHLTCRFAAGKKVGFIKNGTFRGRLFPIIALRMHVEFAQTWAF